MSRLQFAVLALLLVVAALFLASLPERGGDRSSSELAQATAGRGSSDDGAAPQRVDPEVRRPEPDPNAANSHLPPSPLDALKNPGSTPQNDVRILAMLFADYATVFKRVPLGTHQEIVAALRGKNPRSIRYIPEDHPAVNEEDEITDRWDRPFFFHVIASNAVEVISAGPDGELFTDDDIVDTPPHASVEPDLSLLPY